MAKLKERRVKSRCVYKGKAVSFFKDAVSLPDGRKTTREYMKHPGAVAVVAYLNRKTILMQRQYRYPVRKVILEIPAGKMTPGEDPLNCARRELLEETGCWPQKIRRVFSFWPTPAFATEVIHIYVAWDLKPKKVLHRDPDEFMESFKVSFQTALKWVKQGRIRDAKTAIALLFTQAFRFNPYVR